MPVTPGSPITRLYPEVSAGGFTRRDGFTQFYLRVNALLTPESHVLDFGAGRGRWADGDMSPIATMLRSFHERVARVEGVDVDRAVLENPYLASAKVIQPGDALPYADEAFDLVLADYVLEHVTAAHAPAVAREISRVLKPGGWLAARTPNKWGMVGLGARAVPNKWHVRALKTLQPGRKPEDVFPVQYAMNTRRDLMRLFPAPEHRVVAYGHSSHPGYSGRSTVAWRAMAAINRLTPPPLEPMLMIFVQKVPEHQARS